MDMKDLYKEYREIEWTDEQKSFVQKLFSEYEFATILYEKMEQKHTKSLDKSNPLDFRDFEYTTENVI